MLLHSARTPWPQSLLNALGKDADKPPGALGAFELDETVYKGIEGIILAKAYISTGMVGSSTLPLDDGSGSYILPIKLLHPKILGVAVASVTC